MYVYLQAHCLAPAQRSGILRSAMVNTSIAIRDCAVHGLHSYQDPVAVAGMLWLFWTNFLPRIAGGRCVQAMESSSECLTVGKSPKLPRTLLWMFLCGIFAEAGFTTQWKFATQTALLQRRSLTASLAKHVRKSCFQHSE